MEIKVIFVIGRGASELPEVGGDRDNVRRANAKLINLLQFRDHWTDVMTGLNCLRAVCPLVGTGGFQSISHPQILNFGVFTISSAHAL